MNKGFLVVRWHMRSGSVAAMAMAALVVGCGSQIGEPDADGADGPAITPTSSPTAKPPTRAKGMAGRLLTAEDLTEVDNGPVWQTEATRPTEGRDLAGACHRFALQSIGATKAVRRTFSDATSSHTETTATQVVATFPDAKTAKRAYAVLVSWHASCAEQVPDAVVGDLKETEAGAAAAWYHLAQGDMVDGQAQLRRGSRIAVLTITRPDTEKPGGDTLESVLKKAAALL